MTAAGLTPHLAGPRHLPAGLGIRAADPRRRRRRGPHRACAAPSGSWSLRVAHYPAYAVSQEQLRRQDVHRGLPCPGARAGWS